MPSDTSIIHLLLEASITVQIVMGLLVLASLVSWKIIFQKSRVLKKARKEADDFEDRFWGGANLTDLYQGTQRKGELLGLEKIFEAGFKEYARQTRSSTGRNVEGAARAMRVAMSRELDRLESSLAFLATVGSTSPYVGLFGTVWGIMNSFIALGDVQQATLNMVAPGIAEALIATAIGLFAAIPAVVAYNRYADQIDRLTTQYENFAEEFRALLDRKKEAPRRKPDEAAVV